MKSDPIKPDSPKVGSYIHSSDRTSNIAVLSRTAEQYREFVLSKLPKPIVTLKRRSDDWLKERLLLMFSHVDDAFFELASNSHQQQEQDAFFFGMKELRRRHAEILETFQNDLADGYAALLESSAKEDITPDDLSVIANEEMDEILAIEAALKRIGKVTQRAAGHLMTRIEAVCPCDDDIDLLPLRGEKICHAFKRSIDEISLDANPRLVLFKLFEQDVIAALPELYQAMNGLLVERGILPNLERSQALSESSKEAVQPSQRGDDGLLSDIVTLDEMPASPASAVPLGQGAIVANPAQYGAIPSSSDYQSLGGLAGEQPANARGHSENQPISAQDMGIQGLHNAETAQLLKLLKEVQTSANPSAMTGQGGLLRLLAARGGLDTGQVTPEIQRLKVMDGLFNTMLTEQSIANPLKTLLARLQVPVVRAAVADGNFFEQQNHGARQLVNALAQAGIAWRADEHKQGESLSNDPLFKKMNSIVDRAVAEYDDDSKIFTELLEEFHAFTQREQKRLALLERRMLDVEDGKAKAEQARVAVSEAIMNACAGRELHKAIDEIVHTAWHQVMFVLFVKHGEGSQEWEGAVDVLIKLIESTHGLKDFLACEQARQASTGVIASLQAGFEQIEFDSFAAEKLIQNLKALYDGLEPEDAAEKTLEQRLNEIDDDLASLSNTGDKGTSSSLSEQIFTARKSVVDESILDEPVEAIDDQYYTQAKSLARGTWLDYMAPDTDIIRCRLAAVIDTNNTYIFVNRAGKKVLEKTLLGLAMSLKCEELTVVDSSKLFDRALQQVILGLRKNDIPEC